MARLLRTGKLVGGQRLAARAGRGFCALRWFGSRGRRQGGSGLLRPPLIWEPGPAAGRVGASAPSVDLGALLLARGQVALLPSKWMGERRGNRGKVSLPGARTTWAAAASRPYQSRAEKHRPTLPPAPVAPTSTEGAETSYPPNSRPQLPHQQRAQKLRTRQTAGPDSHIN